MFKLEHNLAEDSPTDISEILEEVDRAAGSHARILISGRTLKKEGIARRIHEQSARCLGAFVSMTCADVRIDLMGSLERANRGTLFIDEISELSSPLQEVLLTFLETGRVRRGGSRPELVTDVRIIAASGRDLHDEVVAGRFNAALFYRLNIIHIVVPELRGHDQDVSHRTGTQRRFRLELDAS